MAFPGAGGTKLQLATTLSESMSVCRTIKNRAQGVRDESAVVSIAARGIALLMNDLQVDDDRLVALQSVPGIKAYADSQFIADTDFDISVEFTSVRSAIADVILWVTTNIPKSAGNRWLEIEEIVSGRLVERMLTPVQTAGLRTELDALTATID